MGFYILQIFYRIKGEKRKEEVEREEWGREREKKGKGGRGGEGMDEEGGERREERERNCCLKTTAFGKGSQSWRKPYSQLGGSIAGNSITHLHGHAPLSDTPN